MNVVGPSLASWCLLIGQKPGLKARAFVLGCIGILSSLSGVRALAQQPYAPQSVEVAPVATISSARDLYRGLPPDVDLALNIIAGKADPSKGFGRIVQPVAALEDSNGRLLIADTNPPMIRIFDFAHRKYSEIELATIAKTIGGMATDDSGFLYLSDTAKGRVLILNSKGKFVGYLQEKGQKEAYFLAPAGIAVDDHRGSVFVCDTSRNMVIKMDRSGRVLDKFGTRGGGSGPGEFRSPTEIAIWKGELFVLDSKNARIQRFDLSGKFQSQFKVSPSQGLATDGKALYLSQPGMGRIAVLDHDGSLLLSLKSKSGYQFDPAALSLTQKHCLYVVNRASHVVDLLPLETGNRCR
jgi:DNA-binding beta-propeller fold protein YncE